MLGWIREKMAILELASGGGKFSVSGSTTAGNGASACNNLCVPGGDCLTTIVNDSWDNAHTFYPSSRGKRLGEEPSTLVERAQHMGGSSNGSAGQATASVADWC
jgi:hypothetical protein